VKLNGLKLLRKDWAKDLMYKVDGRSDELPPDSDDELQTITGSVAQGQGKQIALLAPPPAPPPPPPVPGQKRDRSSLSKDSSSVSESSHSKRRKKKKKEKRKLGSMMYGDYFGRGQVTPEVMMMNQMMGMSMMMNNPALAMMGMGSPMMAQMPLMQAAGGMKGKKDDKAKKGKVDDSEGTAQAAGGGAKQAQIDWSKQKEAMIDADDL